MRLVRSLGMCASIIFWQVLVATAHDSFRKLADHLDVDGLADGPTAVVFPELQIFECLLQAHSEVVTYALGDDGGVENVAHVAPPNLPVLRGISSRWIFMVGPRRLAIPVGAVEFYRRPSAHAVVASAWRSRDRCQ